MAEVIDLHQRESKERRVRKARASRRAQAVASALSCGLCPRRCAHCGMAIDEPPLPGRDLGPYPFCAPCLEEYRAFQRWEEGLDDPEAYWHTEEWAEMWRSWLQHMEASDRFRRSAEFLRLMQENQD